MKLFSATEQKPTYDIFFDMRAISPIERLVEISQFGTNQLKTSQEDGTKL